MIRHLLLCFFFIVSYSALKAQPPYFSWAASMGGTLTDRASSVTVDGSGNVITAGVFQGTANFDPNGTANLFAAGSYDGYIAKYTNAGALIWARAISGTAEEQLTAVQVDASGNIYVTGYTSGTVDLDPGAPLVSVTTAGNQDFFIVKLDASGNFIWGKIIGGGDSDIANSLALDASGNVYITGYFSGTTDFDPNAGVVNLTSGGMELYLLKLTTTGDYSWAVKIGGTWPNIAVGNAVTVDASGNVIVGGIFQGTVDLDPGAGTTNVSTVGGDDAMIFKLTSTGTFIWGKAFGSSGQDAVTSVKADGSGNVLSTGYFAGTADFDPGAGTVNLTANFYDPFMYKLDASGNYVWAQKIGGSGAEFGRSIAVDVSGNVFTTGNITGTVDMDPGPADYSPTPAGGDDVYISKLDAAGNFLMGIRFGGTSYDDGRGIALDAAANIFVAGQYNGSADFDPSGNVYEISSEGDYDIFLARYTQTIILPLTFGKFTATIIEDKVKLDWQTLTEENTERFEIERSADGINYSVIGTVAAAGRSTTTKAYSFIDADPETINIYRIKAVDLDGKISYTKSILIRFDNPAGLKVYPSHVIASLQLQTSLKGDLDISIYDAGGRLHKRIRAVNNGGSVSMPVDVSGLVQGVYILQVNNGIEVLNTRFVKR